MSENYSPEPSSLNKKKTISMNRKIAKIDTVLLDG